MNQRKVANHLVIGHFSLIQSAPAPKTISQRLFQNPEIELEPPFNKLRANGNQVFARSW